MFPPGAWSARSARLLFVLLSSGRLALHLERNAMTTSFRHGVSFLMAAPFLMA